MTTGSTHLIVTVSISHDADGHWLHIECDDKKTIFQPVGPFETYAEAKRACNDFTAMACQFGRTLALH